MSIIDIVLLGFILFGAYKGYSKGFLLEIITVLAFVLAVIGGLKLLHEGMSFLESNFNLSGELLPYISFVLIFILIVFLVHMLGKGLKKILDLTLLGSLDNLAGAVLGILKWTFGLSVILWLSTSFGLELPDKWMVNSVVYPYVLIFAPTMVEYCSVIVPFAHDLFDTIKEMLEGDPVT
ncbi:CvpA family protein [Fulvivirga maritima]|uniref:CvpA family protein n=1 Tax=Fulvivirga maritima TaxID=2904247 RepID=UPI001F2E3C8D|nr:CvpA family protein [Fulvivirga maritima]UII27876.1 CvpA family protein [Fulvivirga maritima]